MKSGHSAGVECFRIRYAADPKLRKQQSYKVLEIAEAKLVNDENPSLCAQKMLGRKLGFVGLNHHKGIKVLRKVSNLTAQTSPPTARTTQTASPAAPTAPKILESNTAANTSLNRRQSMTELLTWM